jgi:hypothetical protein
MDSVGREGFQIAIVPLRCCCLYHPWLPDTVRVFGDHAPNNLCDCMKNNHYESRKEYDKRKERSAISTHRRIVFINSTRAFGGLPGYTAYDISRISYSYYLMSTTFSLHISRVAAVTKRIEGTECPALELQKKLLATRKVADYNMLDERRTNSHLTLIRIPFPSWIQSVHL